MSELQFNQQNFDQEVLKSDVPVLIDFWAPWCGPCKMQGPFIDEVAKIYEGKKVNYLQKWQTNRTNDWRSG